MTIKHLSSQFDAEINAISTRIMTMGGLVESQIESAVTALSELNIEIAEQVNQEEKRVNQMEIDIDHELVTMIARRQPTARDLRLLIAISKTTSELERVGDEAAKIARITKSIQALGLTKIFPTSGLLLISELARQLIHNALDAFARLDVDAATTVVHDDDRIDDEFDGLTRKLITYMMEDPRTISVSLDLLFVAKALERIGDHATNIAEFVIYIVRGEDVRHTGLRSKP